MDLDLIRRQLAPNGVLRAAINLSNFLLVSDRTATGEPIGVSPDMARAVADQLGVEVAFVLYDSPGLLADAATDDAWDIGNLGAEPERAKTIRFTSAYAEIEATYLVPDGSPLATIGDVDRPGVRIAVFGRSAYGLWLADHIEHAELVRADSVDESVERFTREGLDALAGLRPRLLQDVESLPGSRILDGQFTAVQQAIGTKPDRKEAAAFLQAFVEGAKASGFVQERIDHHGVTGKLTVAGPADAKP